MGPALMLTECLLLLAIASGAMLPETSMIARLRSFGCTSSSADIVAHTRIKAYKLQGVHGVSEQIGTP